MGFTGFDASTAGADPLREGSGEKPETSLKSRPAVRMPFAFSILFSDLYLAPNVIVTFERWMLIFR